MYISRTDISASSYGHVHGHTDMYSHGLATCRGSGAPRGIAPGSTDGGSAGAHRQEIKGPWYRATLKKVFSDDFRALLHTLALFFGCHTLKRTCQTAFSKLTLSGTPFETSQAQGEAAGMSRGSARRLLDRRAKEVRLSTTIIKIIIIMIMILFMIMIMIMMIIIVLLIIMIIVCIIMVTIAIATQRGASEPPPTEGV